jgi:hypothetical protein
LAKEIAGAVWWRFHQVTITATRRHAWNLHNTQRNTSSDVTVLTGHGSVTLSRG